MPASLQIAVVTGASGYVGTELTKQLLDQGYTVRATTRDPAKNEFLVALGKALPGKLEMWAVDMRQEGAFDEVVHGATYVFHCASVVELGSKDPETDQREIVDPAVNGTANVIHAIVKSKSVKRLVITSSIAAIRNPKKDKPGRIWSDKDWSDCGMDMPYYVSKREAEKKARQLCEEHQIELVTIHPSMIIGPVMTAKGGYSVDSVQDLLKGKPVLSAILDNLYVDNRDVARGHILAAELPNASGRYILSHEATVNRSDVAKLVKKNYPEYPIQECPDEETTRIFDTSKLAELGMTLISVQKSFLDQARCTIALGLVPEPA